MAKNFKLIVDGEVRGVLTIDIQPCGCFQLLVAGDIQVQPIEMSGLEEFQEERLPYHFPGENN